MGVDLKLMPVLGPRFWTCHTLVDLERRSGLWDAIDKLECIDVPEPVWCHMAHDEESGERCYGQVLEDSYGNRLKWATAAELLTLRSHEGVQDNHLNRAAWAYLAELPPDWPIVLYWN